MSPETPALTTLTSCPRALSAALELRRKGVLLGKAEPGVRLSPKATITVAISASVACAGKAGMIAAKSMPEGNRNHGATDACAIIF